MTLIIAYLLLAHMGAGWWAYPLVFIAWIMHLYHIARLTNTP